MSADRKSDAPVNFNTLLLTILMALSGWTLKTVVEQGVVIGAALERLAQHDRAIVEVKSDVARNVEEITRLRVRAAVGGR